MSSDTKSEGNVPHAGDPYFPNENPDGRLWRYMHLPKFIAMLANGGLYHVRADKLGDPYEGMVTDGFMEGIFEELAGIGRPCADAFSKTRQLYFVSSWCMHEHESKSMWDRYAKDPGGVCVESTVATLRAFLPASMRMGLVKYIDYASRDNAPFVTGYDHVLHKRHSFMDEREVRSIIVRQRQEGKLTVPTGELGVWQHVDLGVLVKRVWIGPGSEAWICDMIRELIARYGYSFPVAKSELLNSPRGLPDPNTNSFLFGS